ncbi:MAG: lipoyl synthase, partial [Phycisphaerae bacterium]|nr:lipoyl synthase [Phycisphaerae bacterium]
MTSLPIIPPGSSPKSDVSANASDSAGEPHASQRLPPWLKRPMPTAGMVFTRRVVGASHVATVCEQARCPNLTECWSHRTATFMILGEH